MTPLFRLNSVPETSNYREGNDISGHIPFSIVTESHTRKKQLKAILIKSNGIQLLLETDYIFK